jgi:hypothetical protein
MILRKEKLSILNILQSKKNPHPCPMSAKIAAMMFVHATPISSIDGMTRAVAADMISDRIALVGKQLSSTLMVTLHYGD